MSARTDSWRAQIESGDTDALLDAAWSAIEAVEEIEEAVARPVNLARAALDKYNAIDTDDDPGYHARVDAALDALTPLRALVEALS